MQDPSLLAPRRYQAQGGPGSALPPPYGEAARGRGREGKIDPEQAATAPAAQPEPSKHRLPPPAHAGTVRLRPGGLNRGPQGDLPASGPTSPRSGSAFAGSGKGALPLPPAPVTQHPTSQRPRIPRPRSCEPGARSEPGAGSAAGGAAPAGGLRRAGEAADLSLLLLPCRVQEQVPIPVLFRLHVVVGLLGIIMVHDGARVLRAGFLPPPSLPAAAAAAAPAPAWGGSRAGLGWASGAGLAPLRPVPPRHCSR